MRLSQKIIGCLNSDVSAAGRIADLLLTLVNMVACVLIVIQSLHAPGASWPVWLKIAEAAVILIFSGEYLLRLATARSKLSYIFSFYGFIDLVSILPSIVTIEGFNFLRALKVLRILRFTRMLKTPDFFFGRITRFQLQAVKTLFTVFSILFIFSGFIYFAESASGRSDITIRNFPEAAYFTVTTLSTVGFGDHVVITPLGKFFTAVMILSGAILIPWQAGRLIRMLIRDEGSKEDVTCPGCGLTGHDPDASHCKACGHVIYQRYEGDG